MKTPKAIPLVLACSALLLWSGDLTGEVPGGVHGPVGPVIPELIKYDLQTLELPATEQEPFTIEVRLGDQLQTLILEPFSMRADDFRVLIQGEDGQLREVDAPPPRTYRGIVQGQPQSRVAGSLIDGQLWVVLGNEVGEIWHIQPSSDLGVVGVPNASHVIYKSEDVAPVAGVCGTDDIAQPQVDLGGSAPGGDVTTGTGLSTTDIAFDADVEFFVANGSSVPATVADIENVMGNVEFVYERDTDITYEITVMVIRTSEPDPYSSTNPSTLLSQFRNTWNTSPENFIRKDVAQLFTGKNLDGTIIGIAYVGTICNLSGFGYGVVQSRWSPNSDLRAGLSAHELGHNWNALHCSGGACHIMCAGIGGCGGVFGENLKFGSISISSIVAFRNTRNCLFEQPQPLVLPFFDDFNETSIDTTKWIYNFGGFQSINGVNEPSEPRSLQLDGGSGIYHKDEIRSNFIDMIGQEGAVLSYFTEHIGVEVDESLLIEYWAPNNTWKIINVIISDGVDQTEYDFFTHDLPGDAFHEEFRLRFRTTSNQSNDDWYIDDVSIGMAASCPWDLDDNGIVGASDLLTLLVQWGADPGGPPDFDGDGNVGASDLLAMLVNWGPCP